MHTHTCTCMYLCNYISGLILHHTLQKGKGLIPEATVVVVQGNTLVPYVCTCTQCTCVFNLHTPVLSFISISKL